jgi:hypothetical protein
MRTLYVALVLALVCGLATHQSAAQGAEKEVVHGKWNRTPLKEADFPGDVWWQRVLIMQDKDGKQFDRRYGGIARTWGSYKLINRNTEAWVRDGTCPVGKVIAWYWEKQKR